MYADNADIRLLLTQYTRFKGFYVPQEWAAAHSKSTLRINDLISELLPPGINIIRTYSDKGGLDYLRWNGTELKVLKQLTADEVDMTQGKKKKTFNIFEWIDMKDDAVDAAYILSIRKI